MVKCLWTWKHEQNVKTISGFDHFPVFSLIKTLLCIRTDTTSAFINFVDRKFAFFRRVIAVLCEIRMEFHTPTQRNWSDLIGSVGDQSAWTVHRTGKFSAICCNFIPRMRIKRRTEFHHIFVPFTLTLHERQSKWSFTHTNLKHN